MKTLHLDPTAGDQAASVAEEVDKLLREGKQVAVTVAEERAALVSSAGGTSAWLLSPAR